MIGKSTLSYVELYTGSKTPSCEQIIDTLAVNHVCDIWQCCFTTWYLFLKRLMFKILPDVQNITGCSKYYWSGFFVVKVLYLSTLFIHLLVPTCTGFIYLLNRNPNLFPAIFDQLNTCFSFIVLRGQNWMNYLEHDNLITILSPDDTLSKPASACFKGRLNLLRH